MKRQFIYLFTLFFSSNLFVYAEEEDPTFTIRQGGETREVKASENPALQQIYEKLKDKLGKAPADSEQTTEGTDTSAVSTAEVKAKPKIEGSKPTAESAYRSKDYKTAYEHYQALSAQGDTEASMKLAAMHSRGEGVDKDENMAFAYFARAAEQGDRTAQELIGTTHFDDQQRQDIKDKYKSISEEIDEPEVAKKAAENFNSAQYNSSQHRGIGSPKSIGFNYRPDNEKLKAKNYTPRITRNYDRSPAKSYSKQLAKSYEPKHVRLQKQIKEDSQAEN